MRRNYSNTAPPVALTAAVTATATALPVGSTSGYPAAPFIVGLERGTIREEVCLVTALSTTSLTVTRGFDGTPAQAHDAGAIVEHTVAALDYDEANRHVNAGHVLRVPHTWTVAGAVALPSGQDNLILPMFVAAPAFQTVKIVAVRHYLGAGSATITVTRNDVGIAGYIDIGVTTTPTSTDGPDTFLADNDRLGLWVSAIANAPKNLAFAVWLEYRMEL